MLFSKNAIDIYFDEMGRLPRHNHDESIELFKRLEQGDKKAREMLVCANLRLVVSIAKKFKNHSIPIEDLIQEGNIGLMRAIDKFSWEKGYHFSTYATWWIKQAIGQHILQRKRSIRLPAHSVNLQKKIFQVAEDFKAMFDSEPSVEELALATKASERVVRATILGGKNIISLQDPVGTEADDDVVGDTIADNSPSPFDKFSEAELISMVKKEIQQLSPRELVIMRLRYGLSENEETGDFFAAINDDGEDTKEQTDE
jgi:RNA polymerase primary sigma factor